MSNVQRPLNSSYRKALAEQAANQKRQRIFVAEHQAKAKFWHSEGFGIPTPPFGIPGPAGPGPTQSNESTGHDGASPDDLKA